MADTFLFYDTETSGLNRAFDQILEFAAIRTDLQLNETERFSARIRLRPDVVPSPQAMLVNRIRTDRFSSGRCEYESMREIHAQVNRSGTTSIGYNSIGFDDEFLRFSFYRNLLPPYTHQYANHCRRMDLLPIAVIYWLYRSDALRWPVLNTKFIEVGEPQRGDVAVFRFPLEPGTDYIKRIVGVPGDLVEYRGKRVYFTSSLLANWDKKGAEDEQYLKMYHWDGKALKEGFSIDFYKEKLGRAHHMKFQVRDMSKLRPLHAAVDNPEALSAPAKLRKDEDDAAYVIACPPGYEDACAPLAALRAAPGVSSKVVTTDWIYANYPGQRPDGNTDDATRIRNFLAAAYADWGTRYVLLAGDADSLGAPLLPMRYLRTSLYPTRIPSDVYYGCLDGTFDANANGVFDSGDSVEFVGTITPTLYSGRNAYRLQVDPSGALVLAANSRSLDPAGAEIDLVASNQGSGALTSTTAVALFGFSLSNNYWLLCLLAIPLGLGAGD